jgi:hypothetical protein
VSGDLDEPAVTPEFRLPSEDAAAHRPPAQGSLQVMYCTLCFCLTAVKGPDGTMTGDPLQHEMWHAERGELPA